MPGLPADNLPSSQDGILRSSVDTQQLGRCRNGAEWIAQFVRQHREEFVFLAIAAMNLLVQKAVVEGDRGSRRNVANKLEIGISELSRRAYEDRGHGTQCPAARH